MVWVWTKTISGFDSNLSILDQFISATPLITSGGYICIYIYDHWHIYIYCHIWPRMCPYICLIFHRCMRVCDQFVAYQLTVVATTCVRACVRVCVCVCVCVDRYSCCMGSGAPIAHCLQLQLDTRQSPDLRELRAHVSDVMCIKNNDVKLLSCYNNFKMS